MCVSLCSPWNELRAFRNTHYSAIPTSADPPDEPGRRHACRARRFTRSATVAGILITMYRRLPGRLRTNRTTSFSFGNRSRMKSSEPRLSPLRSIPGFV